jgi:hypothetical protein
MESLKREISALRVNPNDEREHKAIKVLSAMTLGEPMELSEIAKLSEMTTDDALQALQALNFKDKVIQYDIDEDPQRFWRRIK